MPSYISNLFELKLLSELRFQHKHKINSVAYVSDSERKIGLEKLLNLKQVEYDRKENSYFLTDEGELRIAEYKDKFVLYQIEILEVFSLDYYFTEELRLSLKLKIKDQNGFYKDFSFSPRVSIEACESINEKQKLEVITITQIEEILIGDRSQVNLMFDLNHPIPKNLTFDYPNITINSKFLVLGKTNIDLKLLIF